MPKEEFIKPPRNPLAVINVPPEVAARFYEAYAAYNEFRCNQHYNAGLSGVEFRNQWEGITAVLMSLADRSRRADPNHHIPLASELVSGTYDQIVMRVAEELRQ